MAFQKIPNTTLHRGSLANTARIVKLNMVESGVPQLVVDDIPTLVPYHKAVSLFFVKVAAAMTATGITHIPYRASVRYYRNDINQALQIIRLNMGLEAGAPLPGEAPILITDIADFTLAVAATHDFSADFYGATSYSITTMPADFSFDPATGILTNVANSGSGSFNPIITATNSSGSTPSNSVTITYS